LTLPACTIKGDGGTPLLFLHGVGGGHAAWARQLDQFAGRGYRAAAWDAPGYGASPPVEPYGCEQVARALLELIARKFDGGPVVLVGHSMGGFIAQEAYALQPSAVRALVLAFTSPAFGRSEGEFQREFVRQRTAPLDEGKSMADIAAALMPGMRGSRAAPGSLDLAERIMGGVPAQTYRRAVQMLTTFDRRAQLPSIGVPTLLVAGEDDRVAPAAVMERMAQKIPGAEYVCLDGCGHLGPIEQPAEFNRVLGDFLARRVA
jgi:pimeloyl-ACP methyl ester carboxylesterase